MPRRFQNVKIPAFLQAGVYCCVGDFGFESLAAGLSTSIISADPLLSDSVGRTLSCHWWTAK